jgi:alkylhydroperoxidase family enzyme
MSGADPWHGSNTPGPDRSPTDADGSMPSDPKLHALATFALAIHNKKGFVSDADVKAFKAAGYTDAHMAEVVGSYTQMIFTSTFNHMNETPVDFPPAPKL